MNKTETAKQLRLAAEIIETGHPFEVLLGGNWQEARDPAHWIKHAMQIRLALATPPDGRPLSTPWSLPPPPPGKQWHRDDWTEEMLPEGRRPLLIGETGSYEASLDGKTWDSGLCEQSPAHENASAFWRTSRPLPTEPEYIDLGPEDVPPGTVLRGAGEEKDYDGGWCIITSCSRTGIRIWRDCESNPVETQWDTLRHAGSQINRSIPLTGKWDPAAWEPCHKPKPLANG